jgi:hypothetical protein
VITLAKLTAAARKKVPSDKFGLPKQKKYPMPDKGHAANAKARASEMEGKGILSMAQEEEIDAKANKILGKKGKAKPNVRKKAPAKRKR